MGRGSGNSTGRVTLDSMFAAPSRTESSHRIRTHKDNFGRSVFEVVDPDTGVPMSINGAPTKWVVNGDKVQHAEWRDYDGKLHREGGEPALMTIEPGSKGLTCEWWIHGSREFSPYGFTTVWMSAFGEDSSSYFKLENRPDDYEQTGDLAFGDDMPSDITVYSDGSIGEVSWKSYLGKHREPGPMTIQYGFKDKPEYIYFGKNGLVGGVVQDVISCNDKGKIAVFSRNSDEGMNHPKVYFKNSKITTRDGCEVNGDIITFDRDGLPEVSIKGLKQAVKDAALNKVLPKDEIHKARKVASFKPVFPALEDLPR